MMDCEREGCGHPLGFHDPCSKCDCEGYLPVDRRVRVAAITDVVDRSKIRSVRGQRAKERSLGGSAT
jgi:hypothetical protein